MSFEGWLIFVLFWILFVTTPGPNAVNCINNGMTYGFRRSLWGVAAILTQATVFLLLSAAGITALIAASPVVFSWLQVLGAMVLVGLGLRAWIMAARPVRIEEAQGRSIYVRALVIATVNAKSIAGYLAAFSQFVQPDIPIWTQMWAILPTALFITCLSYCGYTAIGTGIGRTALAAVLNIWFRRVLAVCFMVYGALLGAASLSGRA